MASSASSDKLTRLREVIRELDSALVAFSGGVDSALLVHLAHQVLGDKAVSLTAVSPTLPGGEKENAARFVHEIGVRHLFVESNEIHNPKFAENPSDRCYYCKSELFRLCQHHARELGLRWVVEGTQQDDLCGHRPGARAAKELGIRWPLVEAGFGKASVREVARELHLSNWDKPSMACLSSRIPEGTRITAERLSRVDGCEAFLRDHGFQHYRVRFRENEARVELAPGEMARLAEGNLREQFVSRCKVFGFEKVTLDLAGYRVPGEEI